MPAWITLSSMPNTHHQFKGFGDFVELFRAGEQTDSQGRTKIWTHEELDQVVANHMPAPAVIGHPKTDAPAYAWSSELKRDGDLLLGKFRDVEPQFEAMVKEKRFPNRSVRFRKTDQGFQLAHVGWLGATPPAIDGLKQVEFSTEDSDGYEFVSEAYATSVITRTFRRLREFLIDKYSAEEADRVVNDYDLEALADLAAEQREQLERPTSHFNKPDGDSAVPKTYTDEEIQAIRDEARQAAESEFSGQANDYKTQLTQERNQRLTSEFKAQITGLVDAGKLTPAMAEGAVEFMLAIAGDETEFEFSTGEGDKQKDTKQSPADWFKGFLDGLPKAFDFNETGAGEHLDGKGQFEFNAPAGAIVDPDRIELHNKAVEYMNQNNCDYVEAVIAVENK
jgi:hypothetical protein